MTTLVLTRHSQSDSGGTYESIHGAFKIPNNGSWAIENCGRDCHVAIEEDGDSAVHPPYDETNLLSDSQLDVKVFLNADLCANNFRLKSNK